MLLNSINRASEKEVLAMFSKIFEGTIELINVQENKNRRYWFLLKYHYMKKGYIITFENEGSSFCIRIQVDDLFISLMEIKKYENEQNIDNIKQALSILQEILNESVPFKTIIDNQLFVIDKNGDYRKA